jgi:hypothetical protein
LATQLDPIRSFDPMLRLHYLLRDGVVCSSLTPVARPREVKGEKDANLIAQKDVAVN